MEPTSTVSPVDAPARLSSLQKRDLCGQAVAAVITTALIAAPLVMPAPDAAPAIAVRQPQMFVAAAAVVAPAASTSEPPIVAAMAAVTPQRVAVSGRRLRDRGEAISAGAAPLRRRAPVMSVVARPAVESFGLAPVLIAANAAREVPRKTLSRRLTGWLIGSGTPAVRPFPSVTTGSL